MQSSVSSIHLYCPANPLHRRHNVLSSFSFSLSSLPSCTPQTSPSSSPTANTPVSHRPTPRRGSFFTQKSTLFPRRSSVQPYSRQLVTFYRELKKVCELSVPVLWLHTLLPICYSVASLVTVHHMICSIYSCRCAIFAPPITAATAVPLEGTTHQTLLQTSPTWAWPACRHW